MRPALGRLLDLTHRRTVLLFAGAGNIVFMLLMVTTTAWEPWLWMLFLAHRVLLISLFTTILTYGADSIPVSHRTQGLAFFGLSGLIPIALVGPLGELVIDVAGFDGLFIVSAAAMLGSWLIVWTLPVLPIMGRRPRRGFWHALAQRDLLPLWWVTLTFSIGMETLFTFTRTYVADRQIGSAGLFFGVYGVTAATTRIFGGSRYDRLPQSRLIIGSILSLAICLAVMAVAGSAAVLVVAAIAGGMAHGALFPILSSQVVKRARTAERGSAMSIFTSIFDMALLLAAPVVGATIDGFDYRVAFGAVSIVIVLGAVVYSIWDRRLAPVEAGVG
jgi:predicted MFS family arabinose efflux permease